MHLVGFTEEKKLVHTLISSGKFPHATILVGKEGIGKSLFAKNICIELLTHARSLTERGPEAEEIARLIISNSYPDLHVLAKESGKKQISVDQVRELLNEFSLRSYYPLGSCAIIESAHEMNRAACNALLKTLEEPEAGKSILLTTDQPQLLLDTIISRCQVIHCTPRTPEEIAQILSHITNGSLAIQDIQKLSQIIDDSLSGVAHILNSDTANDPEKISQELSKYLHYYSDQISQLDSILEEQYQDSLASNLLQFVRNSTQAKTMSSKDLAGLIIKRASHKLENNPKKFSNLITATSSALSSAQARNLDFELSLASELLEAS